MKLKVFDVCSGIGGFSLGLEQTGFFETVAFCEKNNFCKQVLKKHWKSVPIYNDLKEIGNDTTTIKEKFDLTKKQYNISSSELMRILLEGVVNAR